MTLAESIFFPSLGIFILGFIVLIFWAGCESGKEKQRLVSQCMADGRKEYECRAMFKDNNNTTYVPMVIPVGR